jgi:hypothetical protein
VTPGDQVVVAVDPATPGLDAVLASVTDVLTASGVEPRAITVLASAPWPARFPLPDGVQHATHDPDDATQHAYLASTEDGQRVYLNRLLTDADVVLPIGALVHRPLQPGTLGPWSTIFPALANREALDHALHPPVPTRKAGSTGRFRAADQTAHEVSWLLGAMLQLGIEVGPDGPSGAHSGELTALETYARDHLRSAWSFALEAPAELVVAGIGVPWRPTSWLDLAAGLAVAARACAHDGRIVLVSTLDEPLGPALRALAAQDDPRQGPSVLRGHEHLPDYAIARALASALFSARVYLHSRLDPALVEDLGLIPVPHPEAIRHLASDAPTIALIGSADLLRLDTPDRGLVDSATVPAHESHPDAASAP